MILLACPISHHKEYCMRRWLDHIKKIIGDVHIFLVDNSSNAEWHKQYIEPGVEIYHINPVGRNVDYIRDSRNIIRSKFLLSNYTHLFSLECDVFPPLDVLLNFLSMNKKVACAPYFIGQALHSIICMSKIDRYTTRAGNKVNRPISIRESHNFTGKGILQVDAPGLGCCLIERDVIESTYFRTIPGTNVHDDTFFYIDLKKMEVKVWMDTSLIMEHENSSWDLIKDFK